MYFSSSFRYIRAIIALVLLGVLFAPGILFAGTFTYDFTNVIEPAATTVAQNVALDFMDDGSYYVAGLFNGETDFNPAGAGDVLTPLASYDCFITRYNADETYDFTKSIQSTDICQILSITENDSEDGIFVTGVYRGTIDFDPGAGTSYATSTGQDDVFIAEYDEDLELRWVKTWGGTARDYAVDITTSDTHIYMTGWFTGTTNFDPDGGSDTAVATSYDAYYVKYDFDGNYVDRGVVNGPGPDFSGEIRFYNDALYYSGSFQQTTDFDFGVGTSTRTSNGSADTFLMKMNEDGELEWVTSFGGVNDDYTVKIAVNEEGVFIAGRIRNTVDLDPGSGTEIHEGSTTTDDAYVSKFTHDGEFVWGRALGSTGTAWASALSVNQYGVFYTGAFGGTANFDYLASDERTAVGSFDAYLIMHTYDGDYVFAKTWNGTTSVGTYSLQTFDNGELYVTGYYQSDTDFDPTDDTNTIAVTGATNGYFSKYTYTNTPPTTITLSTTDIDENTPSGTTIATLGTSDTDESDTHTYTLVSGSGSEDNSLFTISGSDLNLAFTPDYEDPQSADGDNVYSIRIQVTDGEETYTTTFEIEVYDIKDTNRSSGSSTTYVCTDPNASNYDIGGKHRQSECEYDTDTTSPTPTTPTTDSSVTALILQNKSIFQTAHDLGITLPAFILNLLGLTPGTPTLPTRDLELGDEGQDVYNLQVFLNTHGYVLTTDGPGAPGSETTRFGALTQAALARFQQEHQISPAVGYYGPVTRDYINANY